MTEPQEMDARFAVIVHDVVDDLSDRINDLADDWTACPARVEIVFHHDEELNLPAQSLNASLWWGDFGILIDTNDEDE